LRLKYGCNPHQSYAAMQPIDSVTTPIRVLNGAPGFINVLDALNAWQLVHEAQIATGLTAAASFKHLSPAGVGLAVPLSPALAQAYEVEGKDLTPATLAYVRARGTDPKSSFGDFAAISEIVDLATAQFLKGVVCDGIIAPGFEAAALAVLRQKKDGTFIVIEADPAFEPPKRERRELLGMWIEQDRNDHQITAIDLANIVCGALTSEATRDLLLGLVSVKYTQSNSVGYALGGQMIGIGAGQQSRIDCTKLAGAKADLWWLGTHPKVLNLPFKQGVKKQDRINWRVRYIEGDLTGSEEQAFRNAIDGSVDPFYVDEKTEWLRQLGGVSLVSDGFIPFRDNIDRASRHGVAFVAEPGGALRDNDVQEACREYGMTLIRTNVRLFHH
jgi:AICAR transformylase/IMP cyclohydrolase PurH